VLSVKAQIGAAKVGLQAPELGVEIVVNRLPVCADADFGRLVMLLTYCLVSDVECPVNVETCAQTAKSINACAGGSSASSQNTWIIEHSQANTCS
jgi:hypothetical protein